MIDEKYIDKGWSVQSVKRNSETSQPDPRNTEFLSSYLDLPEGFHLESRPGTRFDGSKNFAVVTDVTFNDVVLFTLGMMFRHDQLQSLKRKILDTLSEAIRTNQTKGIGETF